jgi:hypothetical protein
MSIWGEIRNDFNDEDKGIAHIDAYLTDDDNEEGRILATINTNTGDVHYYDERAKTDSYAQEMIAEILEDI